MNATAEIQNKAKQVANEIIEQLGGRKFIAMTGSKNILCHSENGESWVRMDLAKNESQANRLKITLTENDTYTLYFYRMRIINYVQPVISQEQTFTGVYNDQLREIFRKVTGMDTYL